MPLRAILVILVNGIIPAVTSIVKTLFAVERSLSEVENEAYASDGSNVEMDNHGDGDGRHNATTPPWNESWLRGYMMYSLPARTSKLLSKTAAAKLLKSINRLIKPEVVEALRSQKSSLEEQLSHAAIKSLLLKQSEEKHLLEAFDNETVSMAISTLTSEGMAKWVKQQATVTAILEAQTLKEKHAKTKTTAHEPRPTKARKRSAPNPKPPTPAGQVNKPPINIIGKVHIPKSIYNFLGLGASFCCEHTQKQTEVQVPELETSVSSNDHPDGFTMEQEEKLRSNKITLEMFLEIQKLFAFLIETANCDPKKLWGSFWDADIKQAELCVSLFKNVNSNSNINPQKKLIDFLKARDVIIKLADKNAGLTIMKKSWYEKKMEEHLHSVDIYQRIDECPKYDILRGLAQFCAKYKSKVMFWYKEKDTKIVPPLIYLMPKIHKTPIGIRPIIPSHSWYTTCAAKYLHRKLYPILKQYKWVITDRLELIQEIEQKKFDSSTVKLATIDENRTIHVD